VKLLLGAIAALALVLAGCGSSKQPPALRAIAYTKFLRGVKQEVWIARPDGSHKRRLAAGRLPALSPDGRWVAFEGACDPTRGCGDLFVVPSSGGKPRRLQDGVAQIDWSPDSRRMLAYHPVSENGGRLLVLDREHRRRIVIASGGLNGWSFSPDGTRVAYSKERRAKDDVYVVGADGGQAHRITHDGSSAFPAWTRNGIVFSRLMSGPGLPNNGWGAHELWRMDADGSNRRSLSGPLPARILGQGISGLEPVAWSNRSLLAGLINEFGSPPYAVDPRTKSVRQIGRFGFRGVADGLSRDGRQVLVETGNVELDRTQHVEVVPFAGGRGHVIARFAGEASWNL
jgi:WD40-like Beta Propeller Repeat